MTVHPYTCYDAELSHSAYFTIMLIEAPTSRLHMLVDFISYYIISQ